MVSIEFSDDVPYRSQHPCAKIGTWLAFLGFVLFGISVPVQLGVSLAFYLCEEGIPVAAWLFVCAETVRPHMNIFDGLMDKEAVP